MLLQASLFLLCSAIPTLAAVIDSRVIEQPDKHPNLPLQVCGTSPPSEDLKQAHSNLQRGNSESRLQNLAIAVASPIVVQVYLHIVATNDQAPRYSPTLRNKIITNQVGSLLLHIPLSHFPSTIIQSPINKTIKNISHISPTP